VVNGFVTIRHRLETVLPKFFPRTMTSFEITTESVSVTNGDLQITAYLALPKQEGRYPAVIVFQEVFGVNDHIQSVTERIARMGFVAIAPAIYQRVAPGFSVGYSNAELELGRSYKLQTKAAELLSDTQATIQYLRYLPQVNPDAIATIGFCFGGHVAYLAATLPEIKATASFYGAGIATTTPGGTTPTLQRTQEIQGTVYLFFGEQDPLIPLAEVDQIEAELSARRINHKIFRYPAIHGFFCDQRDSFQPEAATAAWQEVQKLFQSLQS
jgi:carboxymethylenebutenolidase